MWLLPSAPILFAICLVASSSPALDPPISAENAAPAEGVHTTPASPLNVQLPQIFPTLTPELRHALEVAIPLARKHIAEHSRCRELFKNLDADGLEILDRTLYVPTTREQERTHCRRGHNRALTTVGGSVVKPCRSFARISKQEAAVILIHEALHNAGMTEYPMDREAPDAVEITRMVMLHCGFF